MGNFDDAFIQELARTTWTFYSVGMVIVSLRMYARVHRVGFKGLAIDDYLMVLATTWYTILVVCLNVIAAGGGSNLFYPEEFPSFSQEDIQERILGSKIVVVSEQAMLNVVYTLKACLLIMYSRITSGTRQAKAVKLLAVYCVAGWVAVEVTFFTACRPFQGYWAVPPPNPQCTTLQNYAIVQACFNISSDLAMIVIALVLVHSLKLPLKQKIMLGCVFSMGFFVIIAAILTKAFNLSDVYDATYMLWYTREASVAVYVANLPMIWPLLREWFPILRNFSSRPSKLPSYAQRDEARTTQGGSRHMDDSKNGVSVKMHRMSRMSRLRSVASLNSQHDSPGNMPDEPSKEGFEFNIMGLGSRRASPDSPDSDERVLQSHGASHWGIGDIRTEVTIEIESESPDPFHERGETKANWEQASQIGREVRIEGGEKKDGAPYGGHHHHHHHHP